MMFIPVHTRAEAEKAAPRAMKYFQTAAGYFAFQSPDEYHSWLRQMKFQASTTPRVPVQDNRPPEPPLPTFQR